MLRVQSFVQWCSLNCALLSPPISLCQGYIQVQFLSLLFGEVKALST